VAALAAALPDILAIELLLITVAFLFRDAIRHGLVFHEADTSTMFYPIFAAFHGAVARGELLLWSPNLFSGFALLAEGQTGVLYPPNWLAALLLPPSEGFIWLRIGHFALGTLWAYIFARSLQLAPGPGAVMALSFGLGSFMVGQMQHGSVVASAVWLPLVLALTEFGFRASGLARQRYFLLAGVALGMSALGVHLQAVVMSGGCFLAWVLFRLVVPPRPKPYVWPGFHRVARASAEHLTVAVWVAVLVPVLAMALAAAQLLPLYELSGESGRAAAWTYRDATDYSLPLPNLITLIFPFFFRDGQGSGWSLWQPWEVTYYAGVVPLALALLGLMYLRRREMLFFLPLAVVSTLLALGDYSPLNLFAHLWNLPGINLQRAPARFTYLGVLGVAGLAGLGAQALWDNLPSVQGAPRRRMSFLGVWMAAMVTGLGLLLWHLVSWRSWLEADPFAALRFLEQSYLSQRRDPGVVDSVQRVFSGLWQSLDLANRQTALSLLLLGALLVLVVCWNEFRRARPLWQTLLVLLVAVDMAKFAHEYHSLVPIDEIAEVGETGRFLARQEGLFRVQTHPDVVRPRANQLLPWGIAEARAYDPLELSRHRMLIGSAGYAENWLQDLLGIRFRVLPAVQAGLPSYRQTAFHPQHPLVSGSALNPSGQESWSVPEDRSDELRVISVLEDAFAIADGEKVAEWVLADNLGRQTTIVMRAGRDTAEWTYDDPVYAVPPAHTRATVAFTFDLPAPLASGARQVNLYYTSFPLPERPLVRGVEFRHTNPVGRVQVFGFGLFDRERGRAAQFYSRERYRQVFEEPNVLVIENGGAFPRAFAVPEAVAVSSADDALELLSHGPLQPRRQVVLEGSEAMDHWAPSASSALLRPGARLGEPYGDVKVIHYQAEAVTIHAATEGGYLVLADTYYPGWRAYVDGAETPILRGDYLFRAIALPPGERVVQFFYQPASFESGQAISRLALALTSLALLATFIPVGRIRRHLLAGRAAGPRT
jgi:hypothetical protein